MNKPNKPTGLKSKDFSSDQEVRWCPGCGDYTILKQVQAVLADLGADPEQTVFISGIGCSSRFPYYMNTYGIHGIHGRATSIATGLKVTRPELDIWVITGDGDGLSIGGNHFIHTIRRNLDINILLFNNEIYGLTKGQYSPVSKQGQVTISSPMGSVEQPFNPLSLAIGSGGTFIARAIDRNPKHLHSVLEKAYQHKGTSFVEVYQNCIVYNDAAFSAYTEKTTRDSRSIYLEDGKPLKFGSKNHLGIRLEGFTPVVIDLEKEDYSDDDLWIHDEKDRDKAWILSAMFEDNTKEGQLPRPFGVLLAEQRPTFDHTLHEQFETSHRKHKEANLSKLLAGAETWEVK